MRTVQGVRTTTEAPAPKSRLRRLLPEGRPLSQQQWQKRHAALRALLWGHVVAVLGYALLQGETPAHAVFEAMVVAAPAVVASLPVRSRRLREGACSLGLILASSVLVHLSDGQIEMHFHFFVVIALVTLYQAALPFGLAFGWVLLHHGVVGTIAPESVYNHAAAWENPWLWALVHAGFIGSASLVGIARWKVSEGLALNLERASERHRVVLDALGEGVLLVDPEDGTVRFANRAAKELVGQGLVGSSHAALVHGKDECEGWCPVCRAFLGGFPDGPLNVDVHREDGTTFPAELVVAQSEDPTVPGVVVTFHDRSERDRLRRAEFEVERLAEVGRAQRAEVLALQDTLKPRKPAVDGVELGMHYVPAAGAPVGGDFYDWTVLPDGTLHLAVVDVMGKGLAATKDALAVIHTLRTLSLEGVDLLDLVTRTDALLTEQDPELMATLVIGRYDPRSGELLLAGASHPPALIVRADGEVEEVASEGLAIGYPGAGSASVSTHRLHVSDTLVLYTDGLVEGTRDIGEGVRALQSSAAALRGLEVGALAGALVDQALAEAERQDDSLSLVLRRAVPADAFRLQTPPTPDGVGTARRALHTHLQEVLGAEGADDVTLAFSEVCTNAATATTRAGKEAPVHVEAWAESDRCVVTVTDRAGGLPGHLLGDALPDDDAECGRGLFIAQALCESVRFTRTEDGTRVELTYPLVAGVPSQRSEDVPALVA